MITRKKAGFFLQFDQEQGSIHSLRDGCREYVGEEIPVFKIALRNQEGEQEFAEMPDLCFRGCLEEGDNFRAVYEGCNLVITVICEVGNDITWKIKIEPQDGRLLEWVNFPQIAVPHDLKDNGGTSKILWGFNEGGIVDDLAYREGSEFPYRETRYPSLATIALYPAIVETQFMAYYNEESGLYFGAHDREDNLKGIDFCRYKRGILLQMRHFCNTGYGERYEMGFPMVMKSFRGEWQDAARIYRDWFRERKKEQFVPILENKTLPGWYGESPVIVAYPVRGRHDGDVMNPNKLFPYCNAMKHIERLERELDSKIMVLLMHWEGTAPWAPPYVWPPYGGEEEFGKFVEALHERGDLLGVYCSGIGWTQYSRLVDGYNREQEFEEKNLKEVMCLSPRQELPPSEILPGLREGYDMCPSRPFVKEVLLQEVRSMTEAGIDYIQLMDQQHGGNAYFCYGKNHGHPPAPGKWQVDAMKALYESLREEAGQVLLGTESAAAESFIPYLLFSDNRFHLNYSTGRPVPLYAYLFHEYVNNFMGNQVVLHHWIDHEKSPENILERIAYAFTAGDMMALVLNENGEITWNWGWRKLEDVPEQEAVKTLVRNLNLWRRGAGKKYLHTGRMVKPCRVECGDNRIYGKNGHEFRIGKLHTSAWETADGEWGQFLVNYNTEDVECRISLPEGSYRLSGADDEPRNLPGGCRKIRVKGLSAFLIERI